MTALERARAFEDPVDFSEEILNRRLWARQREILRAVERHRDVSVKGCHASGKTFCVSALPLYWLARYPTGKVFATAPTLRQVKTFWGEIELARQSSLVSFPECSAVGLKINEARYAFGASSSRGVNLQGLHGAKVLIITDESPGILGDIWDAIEGIRAGGEVHIIRLGNPVVPSGPFYDGFTRDRASTHGITISAFDTPNLFNRSAGRPYTIEELLVMSDEELDANPYPYLVTRRWVRDRFLAWGATHAKYVARVLGQFPTQSEHSVFSLEWIERAKRDPTEAEMERAKGGVIQVGIDVAGPGEDETTLTARVNGVIIARGAWSDADPRGPVVRMLGELKRHPLYRLGPVIIDSVGIGYNFALHVQDQGFDVYGFVAGSRAVDPEQFANAKSEAYWTAREWLRLGLVSQLNDEETEAQMTTILFRETPTGRTEVESKDEARKRGIKSPDRAESLVMAFARFVPREQSFESDSGVDISRW